MRSSFVLITLVFCSPFARAESPLHGLPAVVTTHAVAAFPGKDVEKVEIVGKYKTKTYLKAANILQASMSEATVSPKIDDNLDLAKAKSVEFIRPKLGDCKLDTKDFLSSGNGRQMNVIQFFGNNACAEFLQAATGGIEVRFRDVPFLNGGTAREVVLRITN